MGKNTFTALVLLLCSTIPYGCSKEDTPSIDEAFENLSDFTTTEVETTIPRVEISQSGKTLTVLLSVTDQDGKPLEEFSLGNYEIEMLANTNLEVVGKDKIALSVFDENNNDPIAAATTLDYSGSMSNQNILDMEDALRTFVGIKSTSDMLSVIKFATSVEEVQNFTTDTDLLNDAIDFNASIGSSTAFYSSCELGLEQASQLSNVLPLVIGFTDGGDNASSINLQNLILKSQSIGIPIYTIGFGNALQFNLETLANETGGRFYYAPTGEEISDLYQVIDGQLRKLYVLEWEIDYPTGTELIIQITTNYTAGNGDFVDVSTKTLTVQ